MWRYRPQTVPAGTVCSHRSWPIWAGRGPQHLPGQLPGSPSVPVRVWLGAHFPGGKCAVASALRRMSSGLRAGVGRGSVCCVAPLPATPRPGALDVGSRRTCLGRARSYPAACRSVERPMHHLQPMRRSVICLGVPGLVSDLACGGRPSRGLPWAGRARSWRARPGADSYPGYHHLLPPPGPQRPPARAAPSTNRFRIRAFR